MLFFSADEKEVQKVGDSFREAGIICEVRHAPSPKHAKHHYSPEAELWIRDDRDCHRAFMLCVQKNLGFAKRPYVASILDLEDETQNQAFGVETPEMDPSYPAVAH
jgi:hypothetical protein